MNGKPSSSNEIAELSSALTTALMLICNRLIKSKALDREELKADLAAEVESIRDRDPSVLKEMFLSGLAFALHAEPTVSDDSGSALRQYPLEESECLAINDADIDRRLLSEDGH